MLIGLILTVLNLLALAIIIRSLLSWIDPMVRNPISRILHTITEPILAPVRRMLGGGGVSGFDLSPMIVLVVIWVLSSALGSTFR